MTMSTSPAGIAHYILEQITTAYEEEGQDTRGVKWTGAMYYDVATEVTYYEFTTPGSWDGRTWFDERLGGSLDSHDIDTYRGIVH